MFVNHYKILMCIIIKILCGPFVMWHMYYVNFPRGPFVTCHVYQLYDDTWTTSDETCGLYMSAMTYLWCATWIILNLPCVYDTLADQSAADSLLIIKKSGVYTYVCLPIELCVGKNSFSTIFYLPIFTNDLLVGKTIYLRIYYFYLHLRLVGKSQISCSDCLSKRSELNLVKWVWAGLVLEPPNPNFSS